MVVRAKVLIRYQPDFFRPRPDGRRPFVLSNNNLIMIRFLVSACKFWIVVSLAAIFCACTTPR